MFDLRARARSEPRRERKATQSGARAMWLGKRGASTTLASVYGGVEPDRTRE